MQSISSLQCASGKSPTIYLWKEETHRRMIGLEIDSMTGADRRHPEQETPP
jgi:hypothetical protein